MWRAVLRRPGALVALAFLVVICGLSVFAPIISRYTPTQTDVTEKFLSPSLDHFLGTDELGRDLFARVLSGGRLALAISVGATALALAIGSTWGGFTAVRGGWYDDILMRIADALMAVPMVLAALIFVAVFGTSVHSLTAIIGLLEAPWTARVVRGAILSELQDDYCRAARALGATKTRIVFSEVMPNVVPTLMVQVALNMSVAILIEAGLSFFGLGVQPPRASWGSLLLSGYRQLYLSPTYAIAPGALIFLTIWALNTLSDHLQEAMSPRSGPRNFT